MLTRCISSTTLILFFTLSIRSISADDRAKDLLTRLSGPTEDHVWMAVNSGLSAYKKMSLYGDNISISLDKDAGILETNWFPEHKGEVTLRLRITTWQDSFRVDAWQQVGVIFLSEKQTDWSQSVERKVQELIELELENQHRECP